MPYDLRPLVDTAVALNGNPFDRSFRSADFALAVAREFDVKRPLSDGWCAAVLSRLDFVVPYQGGRVAGLWRVLREPPRARLPKPVGLFGKTWGPGPSPGGRP